MVQVAVSLTIVVLTTQNFSSFSQWAMPFPGMEWLKQKNLKNSPNLIEAEEE
jgi:hypothetical protein